ncbi:MAG: hypothetical protein AAB795_01820 [Patescibacteria group bacterium]
MSILELTFTKITYKEFQFPIFSYKQKKIFTIASFSIFCVLMIVYLYVMGTIVTKNYERNRLSIQLQQSSSRAQEIEQQALGIHSIYTTEYFIGHGYVKPKTLGIIKRARDVAEAKISYFY